MLVTVLVPRVDGENVPVMIDANGVTITRNGTTITTPLPAAACTLAVEAPRSLSRGRP